MTTSISGSTGINKIQNDAVDIADLSATGTASASTFLRGDNSWTDALPAQSGNAGKFLTTDASTASWATVDALPAQSGNAGKFLTTDASTASWAEAGGGKVLQVVSATSTAASSTTSASFVASNLTADITPADATSKVLVLITSVGRISNIGSMVYTLYEDGVNIGGSTNGMGKIRRADANGGIDMPLSLIHLASPASTSAVTYRLYYLANPGITAECPPNNGMIQNITLMEIAV
jgi:hypothetical protein